MAKIKRNPAAVEIANRILTEYQPGSVQDMQNALKEIFAPMFEGLLKTELDNHLGYDLHGRKELLGIWIVYPD